MLNKLIQAVLLVIIFTSCSSKIEIPGFAIEQWRSAAVCSSERISGAEIVEKNEVLLLSLTQPEIEGFFGVPPRHELGERSEKFFYYPISESCDSIPDQSLQFRFDALGRTKEVLIVLD